MCHYCLYSPFFCHSHADTSCTTSNETTHISDRLTYNQCPTSLCRISIWPLISRASTIAVVARRTSVKTLMSSNTSNPPTLTRGNERRPSNNASVICAQWMKHCGSGARRRGEIVRKLEWEQVAVLFHVNGHSALYPPLIDCLAVASHQSRGALKCCRARFVSRSLYYLIFGRCVLFGVQCRRPCL